MLSIALFSVSVVGLLSSTVYLVLVILASRKYRNMRGAESQSTFPPVTILKPVHGQEPFLERNLESFFLQDYPDFEIIFGARSADDPAIRIVEKLQARYPKVKSRVVFSGEPEYP